MAAGLWLPNFAQANPNALADHLGLVAKLIAALIKVASARRGADGEERSRRVLVHAERVAHKERSCGVTRYGYFRAVHSRHHCSIIAAASASTLPRCSALSSSSAPLSINASSEAVEVHANRQHGLALSLGLAVTPGTIVPELARTFRPGGQV